MGGALLAAALPHLDDPDPVVRGAAVWAIGRLDPARASAMKQARLAAETDTGVRAEWEAIA